MFRSFLKRRQCARLDTQSSVEIMHDLLYESSERKPGDAESSLFLIESNFAKSTSCVKTIQRNLLPERQRLLFFATPPSPGAVRFPAL